MTRQRRCDAVVDAGDRDAQNHNSLVECTILLARLIVVFYFKTNEEDCSASSSHSTAPALASKLSFIQRLWRTLKTTNRHKKEEQQPVQSNGRRKIGTSLHQARRTEQTTAQDFNRCVWMTSTAPNSVCRFVVLGAVVVVVVRQ